MKRRIGLMILAMLLLPVSVRAENVPADTLRVLFWNLENFFDSRNDSTSVSEGEFSAFGERHWSRRKFETKCRSIAKGILWAASQEGGLPDVIGLAEVENYYVLWHLLRRTVLRKLDYIVTRNTTKFCPDIQAMVFVLQKSPPVYYISDIIGRR